MGKGELDGGSRDDCSKRSYYSIVINIFSRVTNIFVF